MGRQFKGIVDFVQEIDKLDRRIQRDALDLTRAMAENHERVSVAEVRKVIADVNFSGWSGAGRSMDALNVKQLRTRTGHIAVPFRSNAGPFTVADRGRHQGLNTLGASFVGPGVIARNTKMSKGGHTNYTKSGKISRRRPQGVKRWTGSMSGWGVAGKAVAQSDRDARRIADKEFPVILRKHFDVS